MTGCHLELKKYKLTDSAVTESQKEINEKKIKPHN